MFRNFIYLDTDKMYTYIRQIEKQNRPQMKRVSRKDKKSIGAEVSALSLQADNELTMEGEITQDQSFDYDRFEYALEELEGDDFFNFVLHDEYDYTTLPQMKLIRIQNTFEIPEGFDTVELIHKFKSYVVNSIDIDAAQKQLVTDLLENSSADIPIIMENDDITIASKLKAQFLHCESNDLEEYAEQEVFMLCRVIGVVDKDSVEIYNPLKDYIKLSRAIRRSLPNDGKDMGLDSIVIPGPVLKVDIIAIYN